MEAASDQRELELRDYLTVFKRRKLLIAAATVLVTAVALGASLLQTKIYQSSAGVLLQSRASERILVPGDAQGTISSRIALQTEIAVMRSSAVQEAVAKELGGPVSVSISNADDTQVVDVSATGPDAARNAVVANTYAEVYIRVRRQQLVEDLLAAANQVQGKVSDIDRQLQALNAAESPGNDQTSEDAQRQSLLVERTAYSQQLSQLQLAGNITGAGGAQLISRAVPGSEPIRPAPRRNAQLGIALGLLLGLALAFLFEYLDDTVKSKEDLERAAGGVTVLGLIPALPGWRDRQVARLISAEDPGSPAAEAYRSLRTSIQFMAIDRPLRSIQVTSPTASEGKTTTLSNLAIALASSGKRVIVVCCDLRRPRLHEFFDLSNAVGFTTVLVGDTDLDSALQDVPGHPTLQLLASGSPPPNPSELLASPRAADLFRQLRDRCDVVLVDTPPVLPVTDAIVVSGLVDGTILVGTARKATRRAVHRAVELLNQVGAPLVGVVLNGVQEGDSYGDHYGYRYGYRSDRTPSRRRRGGGSKSEPKHDRDSVPLSR